VSGVQRADNPDASKLPKYEWRCEGSFAGADGRAVRNYDDVILLTDIPLEGDESSQHRIPAGTIATVLFFQTEPDGYADLECSWPADGFSFGWARTDSVKLHMTTEEKWPR